MGVRALLVILNLITGLRCGIGLDARRLDLQVDGTELVDQLMHLATFSDDPSPGVTRVLFTGALPASPARRAAACTRRAGDSESPPPPGRAGGGAAAAAALHIGALPPPHVQIKT